MNSIAQRTMIGSMGASLAVPFGGFALVGWLGSGEGGNGPGVGLGIAIFCGVALVALYLAVAFSGIVWAVSLRRVGASPTPMQRYWLGLGAAYLLAGAAVIAATVA